MLRTELCLNPFPGFCSSSPCCSSCSDQSNLMTHSISSPIIHFSRSSCARLSIPKKLITTSSYKSSASSSISCKIYCPRRFSLKSHHSQPHGDFLEASILLTETVKHYHLRKQGFREEVKQFPRKYFPLRTQVRDHRIGVNSVGLGILRRFQNPTIFLKISCEGDFLLPIVVGEFAVERLIDSVDHVEHGDFLNQFQFARNLVAGLDYEVKMVRITKRVVNTYFARVYFSKTGEREIFSVDASPSDAINVARQCKAPIYVNKEIVLTDAVRIAYGTGRVRDSKPIYDVLLDSPIEGPDSLIEEFILVLKMKLAIEEERYNDAVMWRDELAKLRKSGL